MLFQLPQITTSLPFPHYPKHSETITPIAGTCHIPPLTTRINAYKESALSALELAQKTHQCFHFKVYCDRSIPEGGVRATVILYKHNNVIKTSKYHLGKSSKHTVYEAELVGMLLALNLLMSIPSQITGTTLVRLDNQAGICTLTTKKLNLHNTCLIMFWQPCQELTCEARQTVKCSRFS